MDSRLQEYCWGTINSRRASRGRLVFASLQMWTTKRNKTKSATMTSFYLMQHFCGRAVHLLFSRSERSSTGLCTIMLLFAFFFNPCEKKEQSFHFKYSQKKQSLTSVEPLYFYRVRINLLVCQFSLSLNVSQTNTTFRKWHVPALELASNIRVWTVFVGWFNVPRYANCVKSTLPTIWGNFRVLYLLCMLLFYKKKRALNRPFVMTQVRLTRLRVIG